MKYAFARSRSLVDPGEAGMATSNTNKQNTHEKVANQHLLGLKSIGEPGECLRNSQGPWAANLNFSTLPL